MLGFEMRPKRHSAFGIADVFQFHVVDLEVLLEHEASALPSRTLQHGQSSKVGHKTLQDGPGPMESNPFQRKKWITLW